MAVLPNTIYINFNILVPGFKYKLEYRKAEKVNYMLNSDKRGRLSAIHGTCGNGWTVSGGLPLSVNENSDQVYSYVESETRAK